MDSVYAPYFIPIIQYSVAAGYSIISQNWAIGSAYVGAGIIIYGISWLMYLLATHFSYQPDLHLFGNPENSLQYTGNAFSAGSLTAFAVYGALFMWEQYGDQQQTTMSIGIGCGYLLTIILILLSLQYFTDNDMMLTGLMVMFGTGVAVAAYYTAKSVSSNKDLFVNNSSLTFLLAAVLTPVVLGVSAVMYDTILKNNVKKNIHEKNLNNRYYSQEKIPTRFITSDTDFRYRTTVNSPFNPPPFNPSYDSSRRLRNGSQNTAANGSTDTGSQNTTANGSTDTGSQNTTANGSTNTNSRYTTSGSNSSSLANDNG